MTTYTFFTEANFNGYIEQSMIGRTDVNWMYQLGAYHQNINNIDNFDFDIGIYIIPKKNPKLDKLTFELMKSCCTRLGVMQEAHHTNYQNYSIEGQIQYIDFLHQVDFIFCHNDIDLLYYSGLFIHKPVYILPTLMLTDNLNPTITIDRGDRNGTMVGGTMCEWYNGMDSILIAETFDEPIFIPSMGRKHKDEDYLETITYIPYSNWNEWMNNLSRKKYAVHLMRTYAAGSFALNCAYVGVPCLGWNSVNTQRLLWPELSCNEGDMSKMRKIANHLKTNENFRNHVILYAKMILNNTYNKNQFTKTLNDYAKEILS